MSLDMFGEWILILLKYKSGIIARLLLRFWVEIRCGNSVTMCIQRHRKKK